MCGSVKLVAKRYVPNGAVPAGLTLLFTHCTGSHKESWEVVIAELLQLKDSAFNAPVVREAWSVDWQSHGEAATVNENILKIDTEGLSVTEYAAGLRALVCSEHLSGHQLVAIGHSAGVTAILLSTLSLPSDKTPYRAVVFMEPSLVTRDAFNKHGVNRKAALEMMYKAMEARKDTWNSREEALAYFKERLPWKMWDPRILELLARHGLKEVRGRENGEDVTKVSLACTTLQEKKAFADTEPHFTATERIGTLDPQIEVHCILGERSDVVPKYCHDSILELRKVTSIQYVQRAGHFALQENPDGLAACIANVLRSLASARSKL
ncbi:alpha/beta-hydrolase [Fomitopsis serialis]|uniref:alpha/beta-hydrolase n=1 Tax=Fomitopsis serialis TaxID=139415 RepID=UPI002008B6E3|nr:alpha/beta-hydrolase [Neoantrodia serialis]KAH9923362.1 alpha/beta-hydrolase [Neoantrodia serialis]